jgi:hypothetical protein
MKRDPPVGHQEGDNQIQKKLPARSEKLLFWVMVLCGGTLVISTLVLAAQIYHVESTFQAHLDAGGVDDPDVVFGHFNPLMLLAPIAAVASLLGASVSFVGWLFMRVQRHTRKPKNLLQRSTNR